jgi:hypothetical protein
MLSLFQFNVDKLLHSFSSSSAFSDGQFCLSNEHCHLVELLQVAKLPHDSA